MAVRKVTDPADIDELFEWGRDSFDIDWRCSPVRTYPERHELELPGCSMYASYDKAGAPDGYAVIAPDGLVHWLRFDPSRARQIIADMVAAVTADGHPTPWGYVRNDFVRESLISAGIMTAYPQAGRPYAIRWAG